MVIYRTNSEDARRLQQRLEAEGLQVVLERYGNAAYLVLHHDRVQVEALVHTHSRHAVHVPSLDELPSAQPGTA